MRTTALYFAMKVRDESPVLKRQGDTLLDWREPDRSEIYIW